MFLKHLLPVSLDENTVQFASKKLVNTQTRIDVEIALKKHGTLEASYFKVNRFFLIIFLIIKYQE